MTIRFIRGDSQAPKGHAIFFAHSATDSRTVLATYCVVPPMPLSLAKYLPSFLASQLSPEDLQEATNVPVMPIPPMLEEGNTLERLQMLAERHDEHQLQETRQRMLRVAQSLAEKYRGAELTEAAFDPDERGARLAELYLERAYKLLDEEYADIPGIEKAIRELQ